MNIIIILFSLLAGYLFFMMSFYLLARVLFPRIEHSPAEDVVTEQMEIRRIEAKLETKRMAKRNKASYRFNKQPQVA